MSSRRFLCGVESERQEAEVETDKKFAPLVPSQVVVRCPVYVDRVNVHIAARASVSGGTDVKFIIQNDARARLLFCSARGCCARAVAARGCCSITIFSF